MRDQVAPEFGGLQAVLGIAAYEVLDSQDEIAQPVSEILDLRRLARAEKGRRIVVIPVDDDGPRPDLG